MAVDPTMSVNRIVTVFLVLRGGGYPTGRAQGSRLTRMGARHPAEEARPYTVPQMDDRPVVLAPRLPEMRSLRRRHWGLTSGGHVRWRACALADLSGGVRDPSAAGTSACRDHFEESCRR